MSSPPLNVGMMAPSTPPPSLDPPFRGYIETTFDALLVFEAARRGMIPRVTRRLIEREKGMVQSGAVFVFDESESGIKRWTDGLVWSPSRILGNFLIYRETDKKNSATPNKNSTSPPQHSPPSTSSSTRQVPASLGLSQPYDPRVGAPGHLSTPDSRSAAYPQNTGEQPPPLGSGPLARPRSTSEGGGGVDRQRERQLVGSLTNSYKFKEGGLVKKTMSVSVNGYAQHMVSYYTIDDVLTGKLRSPSTIPELASLEISQEYLHKQNFRFPPMIEIGQDGIPRYRGEAEEPSSPTSPTGAYPFLGFPNSAGGNEYYDTSHPHMTSHAPRLASSPRSRSITVPMPIPLPQHTHSAAAGYAGPSSAGSGFYHSPSTSSMHYAPPIVRHGSNSSIHSSTSGVIRPGSSHRRYDPYSQAGSAPSPRLSGGLQYPHPGRRGSQAGIPDQMYTSASGASAYDVKPNISYNYQPPATAPSSFASFTPFNGQAHIAPPVASPMTSPTSATFPSSAQGYATWQPMHDAASASASTSRLMPTSRADFAEPPSSAGSGSSVVERVPTALHMAGNMTGHENWSAHDQVPIASHAEWDAPAPPMNGPPTFGQPVHQAHEEWARPDTGALA
ncbi:hypothetical protein IAU60_000330 [Kwoniella sp. DSM 27419]